MPVWLDQHDIPTGKPWDNAIEAALRSASHVILVLSTASTQSQNVRDELDLALDEGKIIIPIIIDESAPPLRVRRLQRIDFTANYDAALEQLLSVLPTSKPSIQLPNSISLAGQWIGPEDNGVVFFKQSGNRVVGLYDRGEKIVKGVYKGHIDGSTLTYTWQWKDGSVFGAGEFQIVEAGKTLRGLWWYDGEDKTKGYLNVFQYLSDKMPPWLSDEAFDPYLPFLKG